MKRLLLMIGLAAVSLSAVAQIIDMPVAVVRLSETVNLGVRELNQQISVFSQQYMQQYGRDLTAEEKQQILDAMVNDELLLQGAARAGIRATQEEITNYLELQRQQWSQLVGVALTAEQFQAQIERQTKSTWVEYVESITNELIKLKYVRQEKAGIFERVGTPTTTEIEQFYQEQATNFTNPAMIRFQHIYVDLRGRSEAERQEAREFMNSLYRDIHNGVSRFSDVVARSVDDPTYSAADFGYLLRNDAANQGLLGRAFVDTVFSLSTGDISEVLESNVALHIVSILDKRTPRILELDDPVLPGQNVTVRQQIQNLLASQKEQEALAAAIAELVQELRADAEITIFEQNLPW